MTPTTYIPYTSQILHEIANKAIVQIAAHQIGASWRGMLALRGWKVKRKRLRPATDCSDEEVLCIFDVVQ